LPIEGRALVRWRGMGAPSRRPAVADGADEREHIARAKAGDRQAFSQLVRMHQAIVRTYVNAHVRGGSAADDLAQEVFLRAFRRLDAFELPESGTIRPWLLGIARRLVLEHLRSELRRHPVVTLDEQLDGGQLPRDPGDVERRIEALQGCLGKLAPAASALVVRHYFERRTLASLAAEENRRESALRMRLLRIREVLRACIERTLTERAGS
jgi:RNA polymerase sigma-70 factor (ECF subfamily)